MKVLLYTGSWNLIKGSGVGQALLHQEAMLLINGIATTQSWKDDPSVIHVNTVFPDSMFAVWKAKRRGIYVVRYAHSTMEDFKHSFPFSDTLAPLFRRWIRFLYQQGDMVITPTPYSKSLLEQYGVTKPIIVLSNGVDTTHFYPSKEKRTVFRKRFGLSETDMVVISVGHFIERKGILDFLALAKRMPHIQFMWFGHTPSSLMTKQILNAMEAKPANVRFPGFVDQDSLAQAYCGSDMFVFPSHEETEGIVVLEALSSGIPVVVYDIPVYQDWLTDKQNVYKARNLYDFQYLITSQERGTLADLTLQGRKVAQERSIPAMGTQLLALYRQFGIAQGKPAEKITKGSRI
ncbi:MAG: glycosyltransferase [Sphaerochaeta sp.]